MLIVVFIIIFKQIGYLLWPKWSQGQINECKSQIRSIFILLLCYILCLYVRTLWVLIVIIVIRHYVCVNMCVCEPVCIISTDALMYYVGLTLREHFGSTYTLTLKLHASLYVCHFSGGDAGEFARCRHT